jgi:hypothetical protein
VSIVLDTAAPTFRIYIWYEDGDSVPSLVKLDGNVSSSPFRYIGRCPEATSADIG